MVLLGSLVLLLGCQSVARTSGIGSASAQSRDAAKLHFPERWHEGSDPDSTFDFVQQIEVRKLASSNEFFFAALPYGDNDYAHEWSKNAPKPVYSKNSYAVNFTPTPRVRAATKQEWESATRVPTNSHLIHWNDPSLREIEYHGKKFQKSGKYGLSGMLSPGGKWFAIFSYTGERKQDLFMDGGSVHDGDIFWDIYDTATGDKVFEWRARSVKSPTDRSGPVLWLEERYFLFPEDLNEQNFIVVTLPEFVSERNPITVVLPSRTDANGARVPAPVNHPVFMSLPLTKEQEDRIAAQQAPELSETRFPREPGFRELLVAIRQGTERGTRHQAAKGTEPSTDYSYYVLSWYYYAISLDNPTQTRFVSKEEWERAGTRENWRLPNEEEQATESPDSRRQQFRTFPKLGEIAGGSLDYSGDWTAVFSYTPNAGARDSGKMFIEIFERRPGNKFSSTEFPFTGSAEALFKNAVWVSGGYLLVPLNSSMDSFALWQMPGAR